MNIKGQEKKNHFFVVIIGNEKIKEDIGFHPKAIVLKYYQE